MHNPIQTGVLPVDLTRRQAPGYRQARGRGRSRDYDSGTGLYSNLGAYRVMTDNDKTIINWPIEFMSGDKIPVGNIYQLGVSENPAQKPLIKTQIFAIVDCNMD